MTRVRCIVDECVFWHEGFCSAEEIEVDSEVGCLTFMEGGELGKDEEWGDDEELFAPEDWEEDF